MDRYSINKILTLNKSFYSEGSLSFSESRDYFWEGWNKLHQYFTPQDDILDVGCGNGRFGMYAFQHNLCSTYLGVDQSEELISIAKQQLPAVHASVNIGNITQTNWIKDLKEATFDVITLFSILHHIPTYSLREKIINSLIPLLKPNGYLILTNWQLQNFPKTLKKAIDPKTLGIKADELEKNDFIISWERGSPHSRFVHLIDENEIKQLATDADLTLIESYYADGKNNKTNLYSILKRKL